MYREVVPCRHRGRSVVKRKDLGQKDPHFRDFKPRSGFERHLEYRLVYQSLLGLRQTLMSILRHLLFTVLVDFWGGGGRRGGEGDKNYRGGAESEGWGDGEVLS